MSKILIISGTDRPNSNAYKVSHFIMQDYRSHGAEAEILDMCDFPLGDVIGGKYGRHIPDSVRDYNAPVLEADGLVFVVPEYNGSFPGILKLFIDYLPFPRALAKVPVCFIGESNGRFGALRSIEQLQLVCSYRYAYIFPERIFIESVSDNFDAEEGLRDEFVTQLLDSQIVNFIRFVETLTQADLVKKKVP